MSERKTDEIKFRATPSFKAGLQASADALGESMSEYIEKAVQERQWSAMNQSIDGLALANNAIAISEAVVVGLDPDVVSTIELVPLKHDWKFGADRADRSD